MKNNTALAGLLYCTLGAINDGIKADVGMVLAHAKGLLTDTDVAAGVTLYEELCDFGQWAKSLPQHWA